MESPQELKHRPGRDEDGGSATAEAEMKSANDGPKKRDKKKAMAKRGLRSLAPAVVTPLMLTLLVAGVLNLGGWSQPKQLWFVPNWILIAGSAVSASTMALSAWLVWAEGGFHKRPECLYLYMGQLGLGLAWDAAVFGARDARVGLALALALAAAIFQCHRVFKHVNPVAADLVKPCLAWATFVAAMNARLAMV